MTLVRPMESDVQDAVVKTSYYETAERLARR
jgi:hypothetical protein